MGYTMCVRIVAVMTVTLLHVFKPLPDCITIMLQRE
jgi:hypothetical protein